MEISGKKILRTNQGGFITLLSALIVAAVGLSISISLLSLGLGSSRTSFVIEQSYQAGALANACAEEALQIIHDDPLYPAVPETVEITLGQGKCTYEVTKDGDDNRIIKASGTVGTIIRNVRITASLAPSFLVNSWQEVSAF